MDAVVEPLSHGHSIYSKGPPHCSWRVVDRGGGDYLRGASCQQPKGGHGCCGQFEVDNHCALECRLLDLRSQLSPVPEQVEKSHISRAASPDFPEARKVGNCRSNEIFRVIADASRIYPWRDKNQARRNL